MILEPIRDPIKLLEKAIVKGAEDVEKEIVELRSVAERGLRGFLRGDAIPSRDGHDPRCSIVKKQAPAVALKVLQM